MKWFRRIIGISMIYGGIAGSSALGSSDLAWLLIIGGAIVFLGGGIGLVGDDFSGDGEGD